MTGLHGSGKFHPTGVRSPGAPGRSGHPGPREGYDTRNLPRGTEKNHEEEQSKSSSFLPRL